MVATENVPVGELAAIGCAFCWVITAISNETAGKRIGSLSVNLIRLLMGLVPLSIYGLTVRGVAFPIDAEPRTWAWIGVSGLMGFVIGDLGLFRAYVLIGPRLTTLIMASAPVWTSFFGYAVLGEVLSAQQGLGVTLTIGGIGFAVWYRPLTDPKQQLLPGDTQTDIYLSPSNMTLPEIRSYVTESSAGDDAEDPLDRIGCSGITMAFVGAFGQAGALVLGKYGMGEYDPFAATQIRVVAGILGTGVIITATGWWPRLFASLHDRQAMGMTAVGAIFGPFLAIGLSLLAVQLAPTGVAMALMATTPILMLPVSRIRGEAIGWAGGLGAVIAVGGVALLLL